MRQLQTVENHAPICESPDWYRIYFAAMVEGDRDRALLQIARAQRAIEDRLSELRTLPPNSPREPQDLNSALAYLGILLENVGTTGETLLWN